ncbi:MAG: hypothetical protein PVF17_00030 [Ignavibacteria bacterium]|jgi:hypothetical protein
MLFDYDPEYDDDENNPKWIADKVKIKELQAYNEKLEQQVSKLRKKVKELEAKLIKDY